MGSVEQCYSDLRRLCRAENRVTNRTVAIFFRAVIRGARYIGSLNSLPRFWRGCLLPCEVPGDWWHPLQLSATPVLQEGYTICSRLPLQLQVFLCSLIHDTSQCLVPYQRVRVNVKSLFQKQTKTHKLFPPDWQTSITWSKLINIILALHLLDKTVPLERPRRTWEDIIKIGSCIEWGGKGNGLMCLRI
jgi:hypothetical protein